MAGMIRGRVAVSTLGAVLGVLGVALCPCVAGVPAGRVAVPAQVFPAPDLVFRMRDGFLLPARVWRPPAGVASAGVILALHGFTDSRDAWELPAPVFAKAGYTVVAPDQRGFGATADRGVWAGQDVMIADAAELAAQLRARYPGQRLVLMGESMGSAVIICLAARAPATADAYVLTSPAVWGRAQMAFTLTSALWLADHVAPGWRLTGTEIPLDIAACDNRDALIRLARDPLTLRGATVAMLKGLVDLMSAAQDASAHLPANTIVLNGRRDQVVPPAAAADAWAKMPPGVRRAFYLNGYHLLLRDLDRALVEADILSWLADPRRWLPSGADINAAGWTADHGWASSVPGSVPAGTLDGMWQRPVWPF
jgi:alpha-beta hydrolase superfamily lysophospholipase